MWQFRVDRRGVERDSRDKHKQRQGQERGNGNCVNHVVVRLQRFHVGSETVEFSHKGIRVEAKVSSPLSVAAALVKIGHPRAESHTVASMRASRHDTERQRSIAVNTFFGSDESTTPGRCSCIHSKYAA